MKATKKQITEACLEWNKRERLEPNDFRSERNMKKQSAKKIAKEQTEYLIKLIKNCKNK